MGLAKQSRYFVQASNKESVYPNGKSAYTCKMLFLITFYAFWDTSQR